MIDFNLHQLSDNGWRCYRVALYAQNRLRHASGKYAEFWQTIERRAWDMKPKAGPLRRLSVATHGHTAPLPSRS